MNANEQSPAVAYVEWLLSQMTASSRMTLVIETRRTLPVNLGTSAYAGTSALPDAEHVINRLKILSGLSPVRYSQKKEGCFERKNVTCTWVVQTSFLDEALGSMCQIQLKIRRSSNAIAERTSCDK